MVPERTVHYADSGGVQIAYQVIGDGPLDIALAFEWGSNIDLVWTTPGGGPFPAEDSASTVA